MKRTPLARKTGLARKAPLRSTSQRLAGADGEVRGLGRTAGLARQTRLERGKPKRKAKIPPKIRAEVKARSEGRCIVCRRKGRGQLHHVYDERLFPELATTAENLVLVCVECHERHTLAFRRIPRSKLPRCAIRLAVGDWHRGDHLRRFYAEA